MIRIALALCAAALLGAIAGATAMKATRPPGPCLTPLDQDAPRTRAVPRPPHRHDVDADNVVQLDWGRA